MLPIYRGLRAAPRVSARIYLKAAYSVAPPKTATARLEYLEQLEHDGAKSLKVIAKRVEQRARLVQVSALNV